MQRAHLIWPLIVGKQVTYTFHVTSYRFILSYQLLSRTVSPDMPVTLIVST